MLPALRRRVASTSGSFEPSALKGVLSVSVSVELDGIGPLRSHQGDQFAATAGWVNDDLARI